MAVMTGEVSRQARAVCRFTVTGECLSAAEGFALCLGAGECDYDGFRPLGAWDDDGPERS